jgi:uncharacterized protein (DUF1684 family)
VTGDTEPPADWAERLRESRAEKDAFFADDPRSPLPEREREGFDGLDYYPPDPEYRVAATATVHDDPETVEMTVENGTAQRFERVVTFSFDLPRDEPSDESQVGDGDDGDGADATDTDDADDTDASERAAGSSATVSETLHAYRPTAPDAGDGSLFVPFRDKTTGQETYRGGRYMDLHPEGNLSDGDVVTVDFNLAYTPFCAYADAFACPLPPEENWLSSTVPAGERDPPVGE